MKINFCDPIVHVGLLSYEQWFHVELFRHWNMAEDDGLGDLARLQGSAFEYSKLLNNLSLLGFIHTYSPRIVLV